MRDEESARVTRCTFSGRRTHYSSLITRHSIKKVPLPVSPVSPITGVPSQRDKVIIDCNRFIASAASVKSRNEKNRLASNLEKSLHCEKDAG